MKNSIKQIKAKLINEVARSYKNRIERLSKSNSELIQENDILHKKVQELEEKVTQYKDLNRKLQKLMDMEPDERDKVFTKYKIQKELNTNVQSVLNPIYDRLFKSV